jgi:hypothetical protein
MKILRIFVDNNLTAPVNLMLIDSDPTIEPQISSSLLSEINITADVAIEIYLSAHCCNIIKVNIESLSNKRFTEEVVLGLIEDKIIDDISTIKGVMLKNEDTVFVAIFNRDYFNGLLDALGNYTNQIKFIQSFVFTLDYQVDAWTIFLTTDQCLSLIHI